MVNDSQHPVIDTHNGKKKTFKCICVYIESSILYVMYMWTRSILGLKS